jgi:glycosyltransferase involved in cell wall biosynthesis
MSIPSQNSGRISAIVPARNEEAVIGACVQSLAAQAEIEEVLVINDQSTDQTAAIVKKEIESSFKVRLLETNGLPAGWVGKNYAGSIGAREAKGEWLLFTDADAVHSGDSAAKALSIATAEGAAMVSFSPEQVMGNWYEKALIPYVYFRLASKFSYAEVNDPAKSAAAANGQFLMIQRNVYDEIGGHAVVAGEVLEDVALAKKVKGAGYRIWFGSGKGIVRVRMYRSFPAMWEGWKKNLYPLMGNSMTTLAKEYARAIGPIFAILVAAVCAFLLTKSKMIGLGVTVIGVLALSALYAQELKHSGFAGRLTAYGIPGRVLFTGVLAASYLSHRRGRLEWKGREYPVGTPAASKKVTN